ncbi:nitrogen fixation protein NifZ [Thioploca ingrica]|uniref:Nitrogen fixation protein NifZ n=1 Tax=Thioploca ingrica TaxID=40754 RepID=A0A090AMY5_9GAMM|nr:nitrogen fixation protein NifZ [Thioploca ingrica]
MPLHFEPSDAVRVIRNLRNDGTYPGLSTGSLLVRRGSIGYVVDVGIFLQDQVIYSVHFLDSARIVGCRAEELISAEAPWTPSRFETRENVRVIASLTVNGEIVVPAGTVGEILLVLRDTPSGVQYHVHFPGHVLQVPETLLESSVTVD